MSQAQPQSQPPAKTIPSKPGRKPSSVVYWMRVILAGIAAVTNHFLGINNANFGELAFPLAIGIALVFYAASVMIIRNVLHYGEVELKGKNKYITMGGGTFIVIWLMLSVLLNTIA